MCPLARWCVIHQVQPPDDPLPLGNRMIMQACLVLWRGVNEDSHNRTVFLTDLPFFYVHKKRILFYARKYRQFADCRSETRQVSTEPIRRKNLTRDILQ